MVRDSRLQNVKRRGVPITGEHTQTGIAQDEQRQTGIMATDPAPEWHPRVFLSNSL